MGRLSYKHVWDLVTWSKNGYLYADRGEKPFFIFFHSRSPAMLLQKPKKTDKKELVLPQAPNSKHVVIVLNGIYIFKKIMFKKEGVEGNEQKTYYSSSIIN